MRTGADFLYGVIFVWSFSIDLNSNKTAWQQFTASVYVRKPKINLSLVLHERLWRNNNKQYSISGI